VDILERLGVFAVWIIIAGLFGFGYWISITTEKPQCPKCKSLNVEVNSKRKFFLSAVLYAVVVVIFVIPCVLIDDKDIDGLIPLGLVCFLIIAAIALLAFLYNLIRGLIVKQTIYKCRYCKNKFGIDLQSTNL